MKLTNTFSVSAPPDTVFAILLDIPTIAPCMPGAELTGTGDDGSYQGTVKVKLGPISAQYKGVARLVETDQAAHRAVLNAEGSETRGQGTASATITAVCRPDGEGSSVEIETDLKITGKVAQFGRGVLQDVSAKLIDQFADCLATSVLSGDGTASPAASATPPTAPTQTSAPASSPSTTRPQATPRSKPTAEAVDLAEIAGPALAKRVVPLAAALLLLLVLWRILRSRSD